MIIGICSDHAGVDYKARLFAFLKKKGYTVIDYGTDTPESVDYPDFAHQLARAIESGQVETGVALCGTGNGMAITLNHHPSIRAGLAWNKDIGRLIKEHNHANVLVLPARFISYRTALKTLNAWLEARPEGGRHERRVSKIPVSTH
ncbi:MAG: RpiB/LacA/LacB family sugar-phosphate isomerase [Bacteroidales bacterium]|nr:RpiB/LacA/LacB family sugar-phosphate isomerase [Bacteroidales bacterium]